MLKDEEQNFCAKCCKTRNVVERMLEEVPVIKEKIEVIYDNIASIQIIEKFGELDAPVIIINNSIYSEGHVPIIKKLSRTILDLLNTYDRKT